MNPDSINPLRRPARFVIPAIAGIGGALMAAPMARQLKAGFEESHVAVVAGSRAIAEIFERVAGVDRVVEASGGWAGMFRAVRLSPRPDACIVPFPSNGWRHSLLAMASGAKRRVMHGYAAGYFKSLSFLPATRLPAVQGLHDVVQNLYLLRMLGVEPDINEAPRFEVNDAELELAAEKLKGIGVDPSSRPIMIHAGSGMGEMAKQWSAEHFGALIGDLPSICKNPIVLVEGLDEMGISERILRHCSGVRPSTLHLSDSVGILAGVLRLGSIFVGCDTGMAHLAGAVGTPPVTLFAPTDPERRAPFGYRDLAVTPRGKSCSPCCKYPFMATKPTHRCAPPFCINDIRVEDVLEAAMRAGKMGKMGRFNDWVSGV